MEILRQWIQEPSLFELILFLISIVAGVFGAILGLGGGVLIVPTLTLLFGIEIHYAVGASIVSVIATSSGAAATYVRSQLANIRVAMLLEVATTLGALAGALLSPYLPARALFFVFALILFFSLLMMHRRKEEVQSFEGGQDLWAKRLKLNSSYFDVALNRDIPYSLVRVPLGFCLMLGAGFISALLGVGSGALKVPAMDTAMRIPIKVSSATSNLMMGVTAAASAGIYYMRGDIQPLLAAPVALGVLLGSSWGSRVMGRLHSQLIRKVFIVILMGIALQMALKSFGIGMGS